MTARGFDKFGNPCQCSCHTVGGVHIAACCSGPFWEELTLWDVEDSVKLTDIQSESKQKGLDNDD